MNIARHPDSEKLNLSHKEVFGRIYGNYPPRLSEYSFANLYAWRQVYNFKISRYRDGLLIHSEKHGENAFFQPLGTLERESLMRKVLIESRTSFIPVSESKALPLQNYSEFEVVEERDDFDYLYKIDDLIQLQGKRFDGKRNPIRKFV